MVLFAVRLGRGEGGRRAGTVESKREKVGKRKGKLPRTAQKPSCTDDRPLCVCVYVCPLRFVCRQSHEQVALWVELSISKHVQKQLIVRDMHSSTVPKCFSCLFGLFLF